MQRLNCFPSTRSLVFRPALSRVSQPHWRADHSAVFSQEVQGKSHQLRCINTSALLQRRNFHSVSRLSQQPEKLQNKLTQLKEEKAKDLYENIYTWPNALTLSRIIACPILGYYIVNNQFGPAVALLVYAGTTDLVDGWLARKYNMGSVMGSILDPAADKLLVTTLTVTLAINGSLPLWLATLIIGRDVGLSFSAFYWRYKTLPPPKTFMRFWDFSIPSAEVKPTQLSKYNTFLQLCMMGATVVNPLLSAPYALWPLQYLVGSTTVLSGLEYLTSRGVKVLK